jgi:hypothetical protein
MVQIQDPLPAAETHEHHHMPRTGISWLDKILPFSALAISVVSIGVAVHHGEIMNEMAKANERAAAASVWPSLIIDAGTKNIDVGTKQNQVAYLKIVNSGIGPARVESFQIYFKNKPISDIAMLINECCENELDKKLDIALVSYSTIAPNIMGPKDSSNVFEWTSTPETSAAWQKFTLIGQRGEFQLRACYCSVFDQCWETNFQTSRPKPVAECPVNVVQFQGNNLAKAYEERKAAKAQ